MRDKKLCILIFRTKFAFNKLSLVCVDFHRIIFFRIKPTHLNFISVLCGSFTEEIDLKMNQNMCYKNSGKFMKKIVRLFIL